MEFCITLKGYLTENENKHSTSAIDTHDIPTLARLDTSHRHNKVAHLHRHTQENSLNSDSI